MRSYRSRVSHAAAAAALLTAACTEHEPTGIAAGVPDIVSSLDLAIPGDVRDRLIVRNISEKTYESPMGPARNEHLGEGTYSGSEESIDVTAGIWNARTRANFLPGMLSAIGSHEYQGNRGSVDTEARVTYQGATVGTQRSYAQDTYPFLLDALRTHFIWTEARIYTDRECGLSGFGSSAHRASWEAVFGGPVFNFSEIARSSTSSIEYQGACGSPPPTTNTGGTFSSASGGGGDAVCYVWITYDIDTREVIDQQLLFCTDGG
jgi:hypothetical protein